MERATAALTAAMEARLRTAAASSGGGAEGADEAAMAAMRTGGQRARRRWRWTASRAGRDSGEEADEAEAEEGEAEEEAEVGITERPRAQTAEQAVNRWARQMARAGEATEVVAVAVDEAVAGEEGEAEGEGLAVLTATRRKRAERSQHWAQLGHSIANDSRSSLKSCKHTASRVLNKWLLQSCTTRNFGCISQSTAARVASMRNTCDRKRSSSSSYARSKWLEAAEFTKLALPLFELKPLAA